MLPTDRINRKLQSHFSVIVGFRIILYYPSSVLLYRTAPQAFHQLPKDNVAW
jgi:hypothetical protein